MNKVRRRIAERQIKTNKERLEKIAIEKGHVIGKEILTVDCANKPGLILRCKKCKMEGCALSHPKGTETELSGEIITHVCAKKDTK